MSLLFISGALRIRRVVRRHHTAEALARWVVPAAGRPGPRFPG